MRVYNEGSNMRAKMDTLEQHVEAGSPNERQSAAHDPDLPESMGELAEGRTLYGLAIHDTWRVQRPAYGRCVNA